MIMNNTTTGQRICSECGRIEKPTEAFQTILDDDWRAMACLCGDCAPRCSLDLYREDGYDDEQTTGPKGLDN